MLYLNFDCTLKEKKENINSFLNHLLVEKERKIVNCIL